MPESFPSCIAKQKQIVERFSSCANPSEKYEKIIELGRALPPMPSELMTNEAIIPGCQSIVYLHTELRNGVLRFQVASEALISAGLAALLIEAYSEEPPEALLKCKPFFLQELQISSSLSPNRASGLSSMFLRMQRDAMKSLLPL